MWDERLWKPPSSSLSPKKILQFPSSLSCLSCVGKRPEWPVLPPERCPVLLLSSYSQGFLWQRHKKNCPPACKRAFVKFATKKSSINLSSVPGCSIYDLPVFSRVFLSKPFTSLTTTVCNTVSKAREREPAFPELEGGGEMYGTRKGLFHLSAAWNVVILFWQINVPWVHESEKRFMKQVRKRLVHRFWGKYFAFTLPLWFEVCAFTHPFLVKVLPFRLHFETMFSPSPPQEICTYMGDLKIVPTTTASRTTLSSPRSGLRRRWKARQRKGDDLSLFCGTRRSPTRPPIFFPPPHSSSSYSLRAPISPSRALPRFAQIDFNKLFLKKYHVWVS